MKRKKEIGCILKNKTFISLFFDINVQNMKKREKEEEE